MIKKVGINYNKHNISPNFFYPRFVTIILGDTLEWINNDIKEHYLLFRKEIPPYNIIIGKIGPGKSLFKNRLFRFKNRLWMWSSSKREGYYCNLSKRSKQDNQYKERSIFDRYKEFRNFSGYKKFKTIKKNNRQQSPIQILPEPLNLDKEFITLERFLDPKIYQILSKPQYYEIRSKKMTIIFWDLAGFSNLCNELKEEPSILMVFLNEYFNEAIKIIHQFNGVIDKFIGDGIMTYFGFNDEYINGGDCDAVDAALELREKFEFIKNRWITIWNKKLGHKNVIINLKCGIHTGNVLFGLLDMGSRFQVTSIGSSVNLASRLERLAYMNEIIISKVVKDNIDDRYNIEKIKLSNPIESFSNIHYVYKVINKKLSSAKLR